MEEPKTYLPINMHVMFMAAVFLIAKMWQLRHPSVGEWVNKPWYP